MSLLSLEGIEVARGGRTILSLPEFSVNEKEVLVVLGPTGAGKSTLLRILHLLERPDRGQVAWHGETVQWPAPLPLRRRIAMAFQDPLLLSGTTYDNVVYGLQLRRQNGHLGRPRVLEALRMFRIEHLSGQRAATLSGGEAQRTALARALVLRPELLLLDEPFAALDAPIRKLLVEELRQVLRAHGITCVYVTHEQSEAFSLADRIAIIHGGRLLQVGSREDILYRPTSLTAASFMQMGNILPGRVQSRGEGTTRLSVGGRTVVTDEPAEPAEPGAPVFVCIRPEDVLLDRHVESSAAPGHNRLDGQVAALVDLGGTVQVRVDCGLGGHPLLALMTRRAALDLALEAGGAVAATFTSAAVHLIPRRPEESDADA